MNRTDDCSKKRGVSMEKPVSYSTIRKNKKLDAFFSEEKEEVKE